MLVIGIILALVVPLALWLVSKIPTMFLTRMQNRIKLRIKDNNKKLKALQKERSRLDLSIGEVDALKIREEQLLRKESKLFSRNVGLKAYSWIIFSITWLIRFINLIFMLLGGILVPVFVAGIVSAIVIIIIMTGSGGVSDNSSSSSTSRTGKGCYDFMGMDWGQDFSKQLEEIESEYGVETRNWVHIVIIGMNTAQRLKEDGKISYVLPGIYTGIKAVESDQDSQMKTGNPPNGDPVNTMTNFGGAGFAGAFQFDTAWMVLSPYYPDKFKEQRGTTGHAQYYPDTAMGVYVNYQQFFEGGRSWGEHHKNSNIPEAGKILGVDFTDEEIDYMMYLNMLSVEYNATYLMNFVPGYTRADGDSTSIGNAIVAYLFGKEFGFGVTPELVNWIVENSKESTENHRGHVFPKSTVVDLVYGFPSTGFWNGYPAEVSKDSWFYQAMEGQDAKVRDYIYENSGYRKLFPTESYHWRPKYDLTALVTGVYDLWWAVDKLGLCVEEDADSDFQSSGKIGKDLVELAKKYAEEVTISYSHTGAGLLHDCSSYVNGLLRELGYLLDGSTTEKVKLTDSKPVGGSFRSTAGMMKFAKENPNALVKIQGHTYGENNRISRKDFDKVIEPGDILLVANGSHQHTAIYIGKNSAGEHIMAESLAPGLFYAHRDMDLSGEGMEAGLTRLNYEGEYVKYTHIIRMDQIVK